MAFLALLLELENCQLLVMMLRIPNTKQVRKRRNRNQRRQIIKDGWADYEGEVVRSEDVEFKQNYSEETEAPSQVWKEKITIHEEEAPLEVPTTPPNESQDN